MLSLFGEKDCASTLQIVHVKYNVFSQKKPRHLDKSPNEHDLGVL